jgi:CheY-like chemotaxis protein
MPELSSIPAAWLPTAKSILLLEEKSAIGDQHVKVLVARGYQVMMFHSGADAYQSWQRSRPDLVLLSFQQFDQGVLDFLEAIQSASPKQAIAFLQDESICLAPLFQDDQLVRGSQGPGDYLQKIDALLAQ